MIPPDGLHGYDDYPADMPTLTQPPRPMPAMHEVASDEEWHRWRVQWRKWGWVSTPLDGQLIPVEGAEKPAKAKAAPPPKVETPPDDGPGDQDVPF